MIARIEGLSYRYPDAERPALRDAQACFREGGLALVCGPSGGGKSTLLRSLNGLVPQFYGGSYSGSVVVGGHDAATTPARRMATIAGMVFQEPESQAIAERIEDEIAFGMEQQGIAAAEMRRRCNRVLQQLGIEHLRHRRISTLSGGERQRVAMAAVLALQPRMLLLDEPTSQLDGHGAEAVLAALEGRASEGLAVLVAEHRLERLLPVSTEIVAVENGRVRVSKPRDSLDGLAAPPPLVQLAKRLGLSQTPLTVNECRRLIAGIELSVTPSTTVASTGATLLSVDGVSIRYGELEALRDVSLEVREGELIALVGSNGSGKSTLFRAIAGLASPATGRIEFAGKAAPSSVAERTGFAGLVPQDPAFALYRDAVRDEIVETLRLRRCDAGRIDAILDRWKLRPLADRNPRDLSVGQQQRVAIATMLAHDPRIWLLDEPTRGADAQAKGWMAEVLRRHAKSGGAAIVSTHDIESAARFATRVVGLDGGRVAFDLPVRDALGHDGPLPTQVARVVPGALLAGEVSRR